MRTVQTNLIHACLLVNNVLIFSILYATNELFFDFILYVLAVNGHFSFFIIFQIKGNQNGYRASITPLDVYNVRYVKIQSNKRGDFCLRVELCGEGKGPKFLF